MQRRRNETWVGVMFVAVICSMGCECDERKRKEKESEAAKVPRQNIEGLKISQMQNNSHMFAPSEAAAVDEQGRLYLNKDAVISATRLTPFHSWRFASVGR